MSSAKDARLVLVQVVSEEGREIGWGRDVAERLEDRLADVRQAVAAGARSVADCLPGLSGAQGWRLREVSASFGVTLTAEAGALLCTTSAEATFDVTVTFEREE